MVGGGGSWCGGGRVTGSVTGSVIDSGGGWCACGRVVVVWVVMVWSGWWLTVTWCWLVNGGHGVGGGRVG